MEGRSAAEIDRLNILQASLLAMRRAVALLAAVVLVGQQKHAAAARDVDPGRRARVGQRPAHTRRA
jgi:hypothetical protein